MSLSGYVAHKLSKNKPGNRSDIGWEYGIDVDSNSKKVKCKFCSKIFSGGIYRFKHHLACTHKDAEPCISVPDDVKLNVREFLSKNDEAKQRKRQKDVYENEDDEGEDMQIVSKQIDKGARQSFIKRSNVQKTVSEIFKKDLREDVCQMISRFLYTSAIPFNVVKNPYFEKALEMVARHGLGFKPPTYHEVRVKYLKKDVELTHELLRDFKIEWRKTGCSIMSDGWTDKKRRSICNFLVNSPKGTVFLTSIDTSDISKTADKIFQMLDAIVEEVGEENVVQIVSDNTANYKLAGELLMEKRKRLYWTPCAAHCIDLMLEDFEKKIHVNTLTIQSAKSITRYIYSRTLLISMLRHFTDGRNLIRPAKTRFATAYLTLGSFINLKVPLMTMFSSRNWKSSSFSSTVDGKKIEAMVIGSRLWSNIITCLKAARPLIKVLRMVDSDVKPAMGFIYEQMDEAKEKIRVNFNNIKRK
ncbi:uncharacterized protein LOC124943798 [Impatiens glandulifera]|uniref:uncharacterized protein LOC124943798 n=1 Tax=Impatiens glandulifera TaxID=253017 RepID=UPI001FB053DC|nr:uncharacterized protein LOC124943798 [Impatiens glandulifera]